MLLFVAQQFLVPFASVIIGLLFLEPFSPRGGEVGLQWPKSILYTYPGLVGFLYAFAVNAKWRDTARSGQWIWIIPSLFWVHDVFSPGSHMPLSERFAVAFAPSGGTEGLPLLQSVGTFACVCYSIQMLILNRRRHKVDKISTESTRM
jgi:hypothetical protein